MTSRQDALKQITSLAKENGISIREIESALLGSSPTDTIKKSGGNIAIRIFSILGGIFIFAGIAAFIGSFWDDMGSFSRVLITLGSGFVAYIIGVMFFRESRYPAAITPLLLVAACFEIGGLFVLIDEYFNNHTNNWRLASLIVFGVMLVQQGLTFVSLRIPVLLFTSLWCGSAFLSIAFDMLDVPPEWNATIIGLSLLIIAYNLSASTYQHTLQIAYIFGAGFFFTGIVGLFYKAQIYDLGTAIIGTSMLSLSYGVRSKIYQSTLLFSYVVSTIIFLYGWFDVLQNTPFEVLYIAVACSMVYFSVVVHSTALLFISVLSMISYIGYFTAQHFMNSALWPLALIMLGVLFFAVSIGTVKIKKKYM